MTIYDCPAMSWDEFVNIPDGETVYNHRAAQCVALANQYNEGTLGGGFVQVDCALDWWTNPNVADVHGFYRITDNPQAGDIFIGSYGAYDPVNGHIGVVVRSWDGSTFGTMEQNVGGEWVSRHNRPMDNIDGFLRPINSPVPAPPAPLAGNQRQAGPNGANRRAEPSSAPEYLLEPNLEPNEIGNFVGWIHGEDPYGAGNDVWFQGVSGNWFYSGAFTDTGTHDLVDLNSAVVTPEPVVEPTPVPEVPKPVKPSVKPEIIEHKEKPVSKPSASPVNDMTAEQWAARQAALAASVKPVDLGSIITNNKIRKIVWAIYGVLGLVIVAVVGGLQATNQLAPEWFMFALGSYAALGPAFSSLAMANISTKPE
jgi:hypothetical protein